MFNCFLFRLGLIIGVIIAALCVIGCIFCIYFYRGHCLKRQALARARLAAANNILPGCNSPATSNMFQLRHLDSCTADIHERQQLVHDDTAVVLPHIEPPGHVDAKVNY